jgi:hypothetical protein
MVNSCGKPLGRGRIAKWWYRRPVVGTHRWACSDVWIRLLMSTIVIPYEIPKTPNPGAHGTQSRRSPTKEWMLCRHILAGMAYLATSLPRAGAASGCWDGRKKLRCWDSGRAAKSRWVVPESLSGDIGARSSHFALALLYRSRLTPVHTSL